MSGLLVALEGIDGSGTTTLAGHLHEILARRGVAAEFTREPFPDAVGALIREALASSRDMDEAALALLFAANRLRHLAEVVEPALARGRVVVSDRYLWSSLAYQSASLPASWVEAINAQARPADLVILLDAPVDVCLERVARRGQSPDRYEKSIFLSLVRENYLDLARRGAAAGRVATLDATEDPGRIAQRAADMIAESLDLAVG